MSNNEKIDKLKKLHIALIEKGVDDYKTLESTIIQVLSNEFGEENELTKRARRIKQGYAVPSALTHINGLTSDIQYYNEQYKMYIDLINEAENYLILFKATDVAGKKINHNKIYNLLVSGDKNAWESTSVIFDLDRIFEYTEKDLKEKYRNLDTSEIEEIKKFPCIFAYEDYCKKDASLGYIKEIIVRQIGVKIIFEKIEVLSSKVLHELQFELDIKDFEYNRTHWALKKVNLYKELKSINVNIEPSKIDKPVDVTSNYFDVSFTFAGESREFVEPIVRKLEKLIGKNKIFYDKNYLSQLARPSLDTLLQDIYRSRTKLIVVFLCGKYQDKDWCGIEFKAIREMIMERDISKIMFIRLDEGSVDGVFKTDGYIDGTKFTPQEIANFIKERLYFT